MVSAPGGINQVRAYAEWFTWARRRHADPDRCHAAAGAAVTSLMGGSDTAAAVAAAREAAVAPEAARPRIADQGTQNYAGWHAFACLELALDSERAHAAAQAATDAQMLGATPEQAIDRAKAAVGLAPAAMPPPFYATQPRLATVPAAGAAAPAPAEGLALLADPAVRGIGWGLLCLVVPFVAHIYFPVLPMLGLFYGYRALGRSNRALGLAGLGVNGAALLLNAVLLFRVI